MEYLYLALASAGILFTVARRIRMDHWSVRFFDFPLVQLTVFNLTVLVLFSVSIHEWGLFELIVLILLIASIMYNLYVIYPYTPLAKNEVVNAPGDSNEKRHIRILVSNVFMNNRSYDKLLNLVKSENPDILITLETDKAWEKSLIALENEYPYSHKIALKNMYGMHLYSKMPLSQIEERYLIQEDVPSIRCQLTLNDGTPITLYAVHPKPPSPTENDFSTERDGELYKIAMELEDYKDPVIVAGDLNDVAWSHSTRLFQRISGLLDPRKGRGFFNTYNANIPVFRWPLDHVFHSDHFQVARMNKLPDIGSDHFPIGITLCYTARDENEEVENADEEDYREATDKIVEAE